MDMLLARVLSEDPAIIRKGWKHQAVDQKNAPWHDEMAAPESTYSLQFVAFTHPHLSTHAGRLSWEHRKICLGIQGDRTLSERPSAIHRSLRWYAFMGSSYLNRLPRLRQLRISLITNNGALACAGTSSMICTGFGVLGNSRVDLI